MKYLNTVLFLSSQREVLSCRNLEIGISTHEEVSTHEEEMSKDNVGLRRL
jgi:hypothetical protein